MEQLIIIVDSPTEITKDNDGNTIALIDNEALEVIVSVGGGGGSSTLEDLTDTNITAPANEDFLVWDTASSKWINLSAGVLDLATQTSVNNVANDLNTHILDDTNPHMVTAAQVQALPLAGGTMDAAATIGFTDKANFSSGETIAEAATLFNVDYSGGSWVGKNVDLFKLTDPTNSRDFKIRSLFPAFFGATDIAFDGSNSGAVGGAFDGLRFISNGILGLISFSAGSDPNYVGFNPGANSVISSQNFLNIAGQGGGTTLATFSSTDGLDLQMGSGGSNNVINPLPTRPLAFWGATPVVQPSSTGEVAGFTQGTGNNVKEVSTFTGGLGTTAYRVNDIVKHLKTIGLLAE